MPRNISFSLTEVQFPDGSKTVTRRGGWTFLKPDNELMACRKCMGLKKGETVERLGMIRVISVCQERLDTSKAEDVRREGFPDMMPDEFIAFFCASHPGCKPGDIITRIEFERISEQP